MLLSDLSGPCQDVGFHKSEAAVDVQAGELSEDDPATSKTTDSRRTHNVSSRRPVTPAASGADSALYG